MHNYLFDIHTQLGLARCCKLRFSKQNIQTPSIIIPLSNPIFTPLNKIISEILKNYDKRGKKKIPILFSTIYENSSFFIQNHTSDNYERIKISSNSYNDGDSISTNNKHEINEKVINGVPIFRQSQDKWGIPFDFNHSITQIFLNNEIYPEIPIFSDNFPAQKHFRLESYNLEAFRHRISIYDEILAHVNEEQQIFNFILEIPFFTQKEFYQILSEFVNRHKKQIIGIKIRDLFSNMMQYQEIIAFIMTLKQNLSHDMIWILSGKYPPEIVPLAIYLGFDIFDISFIIEESMKGLYHTDTGVSWLRELHYPLCNCFACQQLLGILPGKFEISESQKELLLYHNINFIFTKIVQSKQYIHDGRFRTYIEKEAHNSTFFAASVRWIDQHYSQEIAKRYPIVANHNVVCIGPLSYFRPEIVNYMSNLEKNITPAKNYDLIILLPCAAHKPYSESRSHKRFTKIIQNLTKKKEISYHEVIITSPIGVVPRELETIFPIAHYDIPVTGDWDEIEISITGNLLKNWLSKYQISNKPLDVLVHLTGGYYNACKYAEDLLSNKPQFRFVYSFLEKENQEESSPSSSIGLELLQRKLEILLEPYASKSLDAKKQIFKMTDDEIIIRSLFDYQFGATTGDFVVKNGAILARTPNPNFDEILAFDGLGKILVGRIMKDSGLIKLTSQGARFIYESVNKTVQINTPDMNGTTIFAPLVQDISDNVHPNDEILILNNEKFLIGHGECSISAIDKNQIQFGRVAKLRKKIEPKSSDADILEMLEGDNVE